MSIKIRSYVDGLEDVPDGSKKPPVYKCVLLGDPKSGKTKFYYRFKHKRFIEDDDQTLKRLHPNEIQYCHRDFYFGDFEGRVS